MQPTDCLWREALAAWPAIWLIDLARYLIPAALVALALRLLPSRVRSRRQVRVTQPFAGQALQEFRHSMQTVAIFASNGVLIYLGVRVGLLTIYTDMAQYGWLYGGLSLVLVIVAHDAWFYWTHRFLHTRQMFRWAHRVHHRSVAPTPWAAYSFAPGEAVVQAIFLPLILLILPLHAMMISVFLVHMIVRNVLGHAGVDVVPRAWLAGWWGRWLTTTLHHDMHHAHGRHNYGLYFTWWDKIGRTEHPEYRRRLATFVDGLGRQHVAAVDQPPPINIGSGDKSIAPLAKSKFR